MAFPTRQELDAALPDIAGSPDGSGAVHLLVRRPAPGRREVVEQAQLTVEEGVVGDGWSRRKSWRPRGGPPNPDMQVTLMNVRAIKAIAGHIERWPLAGDQLFVDLNLATASLPPGSRLTVGTAVLEVTAEPHRGCRIFTGHYGADATAFVNSALGKRLNLRGINAKVVQAGTVRVGDSVRVTLST